MRWPSIDLAIDAGPDVTPEDVDQLTHGLRNELLGLDGITVDRAVAPAPPGSRSASAIDVGTLVVAFANSTVLVALTGVLKSWVRRASDRKVTLRFAEDEDIFEITGASRQDVTALLQSWAARHEQQR